MLVGFVIQIANNSNTVMTLNIVISNNTIVTYISWTPSLVLMLFTGFTFLGVSLIFWLSWQRRCYYPSKLLFRDPKPIPKPLATTLGKPTVELLSDRYCRLKFGSTAPSAGKVPILSFLCWQFCCRKNASHNQNPTVATPRQCVLSSDHTLACTTTPWPANRVTEYWVLIPKRLSHPQLQRTARSTVLLLLILVRL